MVSYNKHFLEDFNEALYNEYVEKWKVSPFTFTVLRTYV